MMFLKTKNHMHQYSSRIPLLILICFVLLSQCNKEETVSLIDEIPEAEEPIVYESDNWWNDKVFYQIFVRSFNDSNGDGIGDIQGIIEKLDYLNDGDPNTTSDLGVTGIWLMPIFPSPSYHGYDVTDYRNINPDYGSMDDFKALLTQANARGIKIIIDFVGNHTSTQHPWFEASAISQNKRDWYLWQDSKPNYNGPWGQEVWHERNDAYYYGIFWGGMPDLNFKNQAVTDEIKDIMRFWYQEVGVAGFRIDAVKHWVEQGSQQENTQSTMDWWRDFYGFQKSIDPALLTVGEAWTSTQNIAPYSDSRLDYCFEFDLAEAIINSINNQADFTVKSKMNEVINTYNESQYGTFLTNHDQNRSFERFGMDLKKAKMGASLLLSLPGVPFVYYGEEIGMLGKKPDEEIRRPMQWSSEANAGFSAATPWQALNSNYTEYNVSIQQIDENSLWRHYQKWIQWRNQNDALKKGNYEQIASSGDGNYSFLRYHEASANAVIVFHNLSNLQQNEIVFSRNSSQLPAGEYDLINLSNSNNLGTLVVADNGSFNGELNNLEIASYGSILVQLDKK